MADLRALQAGFAQAIGDPRAVEAAAPLFAGDPQVVADRLAVYRGNALANTGKALSGAYPVIVRLVGEEFFEGLAREYLRRHPSRSGDLNDYGESFAAFLTDFPHVRELPYLPDVARLEWGVHRAHFAADVPAFDVSRLAAIPPERQGDVRFTFNPAVSLVASRFPVDRIWEVNQPAFDGEVNVDLEAGPCVTMIVRPRFRVQVRRLSTAAHAWIDAAARGRRLGQALEAALAIDPAFDLGATLVDLVTDNVITTLDWTTGPS